MSQLVRKSGGKSGETGGGQGFAGSPKKKHKFEAVDKYRSIAEPSEGLYKDKGSRFIAYAFPIESVQEVKPIVDSIKKEHHGARHHCFAYRVRDEWRANDDGEPSGSAGRQILAAIDSVGLSGVLIVVVRYFGGILLGVPGLIRAYRESSADALSKVQTVEKTIKETVTLEFPYEKLNAVLKKVKATPGVTIKVQEMGLDCRLTLSVPLSIAQEAARWGE